MAAKARGSKTPVCQAARRKTPGAQTPVPKTLGARLGAPRFWPQDSRRQTRGTQAPGPKTLGARLVAPRLQAPSLSAQDSGRPDSRPHDSRRQTRGAQTPTSRLSAQDSGAPTLWAPRLLWAPRDRAPRPFAAALKMRSANPQPEVGTPGARGPGTLRLRVERGQLLDPGQEALGRGSRGLVDQADHLGAQAP